MTFLAFPRVGRWGLTTILTVLCGWLLVRPQAAQAGSYVQHWARGSIILQSGDTVDGPITYYHDQETLEVRLPDGTSRTFPAVNVAYFIVSHEQPQKLGYTGSAFNSYPYRAGYPMPAWRSGVTDTSGVKLFVTYLWNGSSDYSDFRAPAFFEQLTDGNVRLLRREQLVERMVTAADPYYRYGGYPMGGGYYTEIRTTFFLASPQGTLTALRTPKRDFLAYFGGKAKQIQAYAKQNRLDFDDARELALILRYAEGL